MAVYKRGKWYWMHDFVNGVEYRMTLRPASGKRR